MNGRKGNTKVTEKAVENCRAKKEKKTTYTS